MNTGTIAEIFKELIRDLPSVISDTLQEPTTNMIIFFSDDGGPRPTVSSSDSNDLDECNAHLPGDTSDFNSTMKFAKSHPSKLFQSKVSRHLSTLTTF